MYSLYRRKVARGRWAMPRGKFDSARRSWKNSGRASIVRCPCAAVHLEGNKSQPVGGECASVCRTIVRSNLIRTQRERAPRVWACVCARTRCRRRIARSNARYRASPPAERRAATRARADDRTNDTRDTVFASRRARRERPSCLLCHPRGYSNRIRRLGGHFPTYEAAGSFERDSLRKTLRADLRSSVRAVFGRPLIRERLFARPRGRFIEQAKREPAFAFPHGSHVVHVHRKRARARLDFRGEDGRARALLLFFRRACLPVASCANGNPSGGVFSR